MLNEKSRETPLESTVGQGHRVTTKPGRILVLDAECNAATCVVQSLGRAGHRIHLGGVSDNPFSAQSRYVERSFQYPSPLESRRIFLEWFQALMDFESYDFILPLSDVTLYPLRSLSPRYPGLVLPPEESFDWFFDKSKTLELAKRCNVPAPKTSLFHSADEIEPGLFQTFPYFVKLTRSKIWVGDRGFDLEARLVRNSGELLESVRSLTRYGPVLVQEYEPGEGVGIEMLCDRGRVLMAFAHQRIHEYPLTGGGSTYRVSIPLPPALLEASERLVKEAAWSGVAMVEFKNDDDRFSLMEVNGRFWGSLPLSYRCGMDFPKALIDLLEGDPVKERTSYPVGIYSRRFATDFSWFKRNLVADRSDPFTKTRSLGKTLLEYGRFLSGRDHWDHASLSDPMPVLAEIDRTIKKNIHDVVLKGKDFVTRRLGPSRSRNLLNKQMAQRGDSDQPVRILVLCYGNICRSPFVEVLLQKVLEPRHFEVRSCGFVKTEGRVSPEDYIPLAAKAGVDLSSHRSCLISRKDISWADFILLMDLKNFRDMKKFAPDSLEKILWLGAWKDSGPREISDPYGKSSDQMERIISEMKRATISFSKDLMNAFSKIGEGEQ